MLLTLKVFIWINKSSLSTELQLAMDSTVRKIATVSLLWHSRKMTIMRKYLNDKTERSQLSVVSSKFDDLLYVKSIWNIFLAKPICLKVDMEWTKYSEGLTSISRLFSAGEEKPSLLTLSANRIAFNYLVWAKTSAIVHNHFPLLSEIADNITSVVF